MYTRWDVNTKTINCKVDGNEIQGLTEYTPKIDQVGYLRLEDVALTTLPGDGDYLEKLRIISNYICKKNIPFHITWIPRYIGSNNCVDVNPIHRNDFTIAELAYTLDFCIEHKASIGLHGYTHQRGNDTSGEGFEFGNKYPSVDELRSRLEKAKAIGEYLDIPIDFFEAPHYAITPEQLKVAESYFRIMYEPFEAFGLSKVNLKSPQLSPYNKTSYYVSTPLDYIDFNNPNASIAKIQNADIKNMGSLFIHPRLDFKYINLTEYNGIPNYEYANDSVIKKTVDALQTKGFKMSYVRDIK